MALPPDFYCLFYMLCHYSGSYFRFMDAVITMDWDSDNDNDDDINDDDVFPLK